MTWYDNLYRTSESLSYLTDMIFIISKINDKDGKTQGNEKKNEEI